ncbi:unnamed protein product [Aureobasidium mustum]|uniref:Uncharacterized protein n=1 Tax=Aureobasidium mustum TaxID=2773714 RepID=A0A9N8JG71_9PEZI|nr:unnamed protein product [Aureobasidium mustum]
MGPWLAVLEAWLVKDYLRAKHSTRVSDEFTRAFIAYATVLWKETKAAQTSRVRQGPGFGKHFWDEIQAQVGRKNLENPLEKPDPTRTTRTHHPPPNQPVQEQTTRQRTDLPPQPPKEGFLSHFMDELRSQTRGRDKNP